MGWRGEGEPGSGRGLAHSRGVRAGTRACERCEGSFAVSRGQPTLLRVRGGEHVPGGLGWKRLRDRWTRGASKREGASARSPDRHEPCPASKDKRRAANGVPARPPLAIGERKNIRTS
jgi:hypothetical protein